MKTIAKCCAAALILAAAGGCTTLFGSSQYRLYIDSDEQNATCQISSNAMPMTKLLTLPQEVTLPSGAKEGGPARYTFKFEAPDGRIVIKKREAHFSILSLGNFILLGGFPGFMADYASGTMWTLKDHNVYGNFNNRGVVRHNEPMRGYNVDQYIRMDLEELEKEYRSGKIDKAEYTSRKA
ncbi:MAG: hypothetical protein IJ802_06285 [Kiritimatiellae bacterium]|nr:hypothetical protein [Kiritimatiellia bacterium]